jgi:periplasmic mercuric ion binding protein
MRTLKFFFSAIVALVLSVSVMGQVAGNKTEMIKVSGNCESCKARIEKAAKVEGVSKADWNEKTKMLTLVYNPSKVKSDAVQKTIAAVGHDTPKFKADVKVYNALPGCCKYR